MTLRAITNDDPPALFPSLPKPLADEVFRQRLIDVLAQRWNAALVTVEAPGGFGKSTVSAQAIRDNADDPSGIDIHVRCRRSQRSLGDVLADIEQQLCEELDIAAPEGNDDAIARLADLVAALSPAAVSVWIDDAHVIADLEGEESCDTLADVLERLPANGHLVVVGRRLPPLPIARLRAADECVALGASDLLFDEAERVALAEGHGRDVSVTDRAEGWPALSRLALVSESLSHDYLFDEIVDAMSEGDREAVALAQINDRVDAALLEACNVECDLKRLGRLVPLLDVYEDGSISAHDLWLDEEVRVVAPERRTELARLVASHHASLDRYDTAIRLGCDEQLWADARRWVVAALARGDGGLSATRCRGWLRAFPADQHGQPELELLLGVTLGLEGSQRDGVELVQRAARALADVGDLRGQSAALMDLGVRAWALGDIGVISPLFDLIPALLESGDPIALNMVGGQRAGDLDLAGEPQQALDVLRGLKENDLGLRHQSTLEMLLGNTERAVRLVERLVELYPIDFNRRILGLTRFAAGDPTDVLSPDFPTLDAIDASRNLLLNTVAETAVRSALGESLPPESIAGLDRPRSRDVIFALIVDVADSVVNHDDAAAAASIANALDSVGWDEPLVKAELRRFLPFMYVLSDRARGILDDDELAGHHVVQRELCRSLMAARADPGAVIGVLPPASVTFCFLPLSWSVELACLLAARNDRRAAGLLDELANLAGANTQVELRRQASRHGQWAAGASQLIASVPIAPRVPSHLTLFGSPSLRSGDVTTDVTRGRNRQLLAALALRRRISRVAVGQLIWSDGDAQKTQTSLRVALSQVRSLLDADRAGSEASFHLRDHDGTLSLVESEWLGCDLWDVDRLLELGQPFEALEIVARGVHDDLREVAALAHEFDTLQQRTVAGACASAEQLLAQGQNVEAATAARTVLLFDGLCERAHSVLIAALLGSNALDEARIAIGNCVDALEELDVEPGLATSMLFRRYERRSGDAVRTAV